MTEEIWKDIKGYEGLYQVSNIGRVKSLDRIDIIGRKIKGFYISPKNDSDYQRLNLYKNGNRKTYSIHRLVAEAFIPNPENKLTVNHINHIRHDNRVENLEWATYAEQNDKIRNERSGKTLKKIWNEKVPDVIINGVSYSSIREASRTLNLNKSSIGYAIKNNKPSFKSKGVVYEVGVK